MHEDKVRVSSPQGHYLVKRFVYRANITIRPLTIVSTGPALGGSGPGGLDVVHEDWVGDVVLEVEGTVEHSNLLLNRVSGGSSRRASGVCVPARPRQALTHRIDFLSFPDRSPLTRLRPIVF